MFLQRLIGYTIFLFSISVLSLFWQKSTNEGNKKITTTSIVKWNKQLENNKIADASSLVKSLKLKSIKVKGNNIFSKSDQKTFQHVLLFLNKTGENQLLLTENNSNSENTKLNNLDLKNFLTDDSLSLTAEIIIDSEHQNEIKENTIFDL